jgi:hypothetical protein
LAQYKYGQRIFVLLLTTATSSGIVSSEIKSGWAARKKAKMKMKMRNYIVRHLETGAEDTHAGENPHSLLCGVSHTETLGHMTESERWDPDLRVWAVRPEDAMSLLAGERKYATPTNNND